MEIILGYLYWDKKKLLDEKNWGKKSHKILLFQGKSQKNLKDFAAINAAKTLIWRQILMTKNAKKWTRHKSKLNIGICKKFNLRIEVETLSRVQPNLRGIGNREFSFICIHLDEVCFKGRVSRD